MSISVALCTYNGEDYLEAQLKSILSQTRKPDEIVVCDDGSTDQTVEILQRYEDSHPELFDVHFNEKTLGVTKNFERAIRLTTGDFVVLSDQDDIWHERKLERQIPILFESEAQLTFHNSLVVDGELNPITTLWDSIDYKFETGLEPIEFFKELMLRNIVQGATMAFTSELTDRVLPIPKGWDHDYYIALISSITCQCVPINDCLLYYRQHPNQDLGISNRSISSKIISSVNLDYKKLSKKRDRWRVLRESIKQMRSEEIIPNEEDIYHLLHQREKYDSNRASAHNTSKPFEHRLTSVGINMYNLLYFKFGAGGIKISSGSIVQGILEGTGNFVRDLGAAIYG